MPSPRHLLLVLFATLSTAVSARWLPAQETRPEAGYAMACGLQQRGLWQEAARALRACLQQDPPPAPRAELLYRLGCCVAELTPTAAAGEAPAKEEAAGPAAAIALLTDAVAAAAAGTTWLPECRYRLAGLLQATAQWPAAAEQFRTLAASLPTAHYLTAAAWYGCGEALVAQGQDEAASEAFAAAAQHATGERADYRGPALYRQALALRRLGQLAAAAPVFSSAATSFPDGPAAQECRWLAADCRVRVGSDAAAERELEALAALPGAIADQAAYSHCLAALLRGDTAAATTRLQQFVGQRKAAPGHAAAAVELARLLLAQQDWTSARQHLRTVLQDAKASALHATAQELLGQCELASGSAEPALAALRAALATAADAGKPRLWLLLGEAHGKLGQWQQALACYDEVVQHDEAGFGAPALYGAAHALHQLGQHARCRERAAQLLQRWPQHALAEHAALAIAESHYAERQFDAAAAGYTALLASPQFAAQAAWKLAFCHHLRGDAAAAATAFAAIAEDRAHPEAAAALAMAALAAAEAGEGSTALAHADRYRLRYPDGPARERCERIAARVLQQQGQFAAAAQRLAAAEAAQGTAAAELPALRLQQAELLRQAGDFQAAMAGYTALAKAEGPVGQRARFGAAACQFELGDLPACLALLQTALAQPTGDLLPRLLELQIAALQRSEAWGAAAAAALRFLAECPNDAAAAQMPLQAGICLSRAGRHAAAAEQLQPLLERDPAAADGRVAYELAWAHQQLGDQQAALAAFALVHQHGRDKSLRQEAAQHLLLAALARGDLPQARELLAGLEGSTVGPYLMRLAAAETTAAGEDPTALQTARARWLELAARPQEPLAAEALRSAARCSQALGDWPACLQQLQQFLELAPQHPEADLARRLLGEAAVRTGAAELAIPALQAFLQQESLPAGQRADALLWLGQARLLRRDGEAAEAAFQRAGELDPGAIGAEATCRLGEARAARGDQQAAIEAWLRLPILFAEPQWASRGLFLAATAYDNLGQRDRAERLLRELLQHHPDSAEAERAKARLQPR